MADTTFGNNFGSISEGEDLGGAVAALLAELERGPFAPALAGDILARFSIKGKLSDLVKLHLADRVVLISNQHFSPVGRPALALIDKLRDPSYWARFRLASLFRVWEGAQVDISVLDRQEEADSSFARKFRVGLTFAGKVIRRSFSVSGFVVEISVDGEVFSCFLPAENVPSVFRDNPDSLVGMEGVFEVANVLPMKRSVLLRIVRLRQTAMTVPKSGNLTVDGADVERRLILVRSLLEKGLITQTQYEAKQAQILADL